MRDTFQPCVYLLANRQYGALYTGVTSNLLARLQQHREEMLRGHSADYAIKRLVWYEQHERMDTAILREKRIKKWYRQWKINLIETDNPSWRDLAVDFGLPMLPPRPVHVERAGVGSPPSRG